LNGSLLRGLQRVGTVGLLALVAACGEPEGEPAPDPGEPDGPVLTLAVLPYTAPSRVTQRFAPLADYLESALERPVRLHVSRDYAEPLRMLAEGRADLAYLGATSLIRLQRRYPDVAGLEPLAAEGGYRAAIMVRADSPYQERADLAGETFAFGAYRSLSSHYAPRRMLAEAGVELADLADYEFLHRQGRVARSVVHGDYAAGAVNLDLARRFQRAGEVRIIARSPALPPPMVVAGPALGEEERRRVRRLLRDPMRGIEGEVPAYVPHFEAPDPALQAVGRRYMEAVERPCPPGAEKPGTEE